ncbi:hypothetical protein EVJ27_06015 [Exiguobacterium sp. SH3S2]|uniref:hypothetical protein n=1 Tax=unclassified Exiguobacterium TaxID=2644629 RepID=UPI00103A6E3C|nr:MULTISPECIES: hypothetical protein [unclassified Exiguobacterium]TCI46454.1 hypothetical protein EVJ28_06010 [Exiguobacterium sp. SH3S3]TCI62096.1 hypothetical protein EVJ27_06015 [Exiguobacterium sp. SH3S2]
MSFDHELFEAFNSQIQYLLNTYDKVYRRQEDTQKLVSKTVDTIQNFTGMDELEVVNHIFERAKLHVSPFVGDRIIAECFLYLFNRQKANLEFVPYDKEENLVMSYLDLLKEKITKNMAQHMVETHNGRYILPVFHSLGELVQGVELEKGYFKSFEYRSTRKNGYSDYDDEVDDTNEALYWIAVGEGEIDPSESRETTYLSRYDEDDVPMSDMYRNALRFSGYALEFYFDLICNSPDIDDGFKQQHLEKILIQLKAFIDTSEMQKSLKMVKERVMKDKIQPFVAAKNEKDDSFKQFVSGYSHSLLRATIDNIYHVLSTKHGTRVSFGPEGAKEFIGSILLAEFDPSTQEYVFFGIEKVFEEEWGALTFSNYMDNVIHEKSVITYNSWSDVFHYLNDHHLWIRTHECSRNG